MTVWAPMFLGIRLVATVDHIAALVRAADRDDRPLSFLMVLPRMADVPKYVARIERAHEKRKTSAPSSAASDREQTNYVEARA